MHALSQYFRFVFTLGEYVQFVLNVMGACLRKFPRWGLIREQLYFIGVLSVPVVALTGFSTGLVLAAQSFYQLANKGLAGITGLMVTKAMFTELGPVLTAFMLIGRVGSSMTAELGTMQVTDQLDALKSMSIDPNQYLIAPRFLAGFFMCPVLTIFSTVMGIFGGYLIAVYYFDMAPVTFFTPIEIYVTNFDIFVCIFKGLIFGILTVTICCFRGMRTFGGAQGVGKATTNAVVISYVTILFINFFLTVGLNICYELVMGVSN